MGVYIKGMEMPTTCGNCWFCHAVGNDKWHCRLSGKSFSSWSVGWGNENNTGENGQHPYIRRDDCPLVPVPPHGRLIDADALEKRIKDEGRNQAEYYADRYAPVVMAYGDCYGKVESAPTIIPSDKESGE